MANNCGKTINDYNPGRPPRRDKQQNLLVNMKISHENEN